MARRPLRHTTYWALVSIFLWIVTFAGIYVIIRRVHMYQGEPVHPATGLGPAAAVATLVTGFVAGFAYLIVFGAMTREERERGERGLHGTVEPESHDDAPPEIR